MNNLFYETFNFDIKSMLIYYYFFFLLASNQNIQILNCLDIFSYNTSDVIPLNYIIFVFDYILVILQAINLFMQF